MELLSTGRRIQKKKAGSLAAVTWNTWRPIWATARLILVPSRSAAGWNRTPYISSLRAISRIWKSDSAGVWPLEEATKQTDELMSHENMLFFEIWKLALDVSATVDCADLIIILLYRLEPALCHSKSVPKNRHRHSTAVQKDRHHVDRRRGLERNHQNKTFKITGQSNWDVAALWAPFLFQEDILIKLHFKPMTLNRINLPCGAQCTACRVYFVVCDLPHQIQTKIMSRLLSGLNLGSLLISRIWEALSKTMWLQPNSMLGRHIHPIITTF